MPPRQGHAAALQGKGAKPSAASVRELQALLQSESVLSPKLQEQAEAHLTLLLQPVSTRKKTELRELAAQYVPLLGKLVSFCKL